MNTAPETTGSSVRKRVSAWLPAAAFAVLLALFAVRSQRPAALAHWKTDFDAALSHAAATERLVLVAFVMRGCTWCDVMERQVLSTARVEAALDTYVPVRLDVEEQRELANRLGVLGTPTYAVIDPEGQVRAVARGYQPVDAFVRFLRRALREGSQGGE